jgi:RimJ/RimL family protein N-acetyltransferase
MDSPRSTADPAVMEFFPEPNTEERTRRFVSRIRERWTELGYGLWAVERKDTGSFIGYVGLWPATFPAHFTPAVEIGWRLAADQWGQGCLGMRRAASFEHPNVPAGHPARAHVLYRIRREDLRA